MPSDRWLRSIEPHMDGSHTVSVSKYRDGRPGTVGVKVPAGYELVPCGSLAERDALAELVRQVSDLRPIFNDEYGVVWWSVCNCTVTPAQADLIERITTTEEA